MTYADPKMASDDPSVHNNDTFKLEELFNVKDKVALVTGMSYSNSKHIQAADIS